MSSSPSRSGWKPICPPGRHSPLDSSHRCTASNRSPRIRYLLTRETIVLVHTSARSHLRHQHTPPGSLPDRMSREVEMKARVVLCAFLIACGKVESGGDVTLTLQPPSVFFRRGETAMVQVTAADAVNQIDIAATGLPPGVTADP